MSYIVILMNFQTSTLLTMVLYRHTESTELLQQGALTPPPKKPPKKPLRINHFLQMVNKIMVNIACTCLHKT